MFDKDKTIIIGQGDGISKKLSKEFGIKNLSSRVFKNLDFSNYNHIIYTSTDTAIDISKSNISTYLEKNIINIQSIVESNFTGKFTYISSVDSGAYMAKKFGFVDQYEEMFTPYSFSKYCSELLILSNKKSFQNYSILRLGLLWPPKNDSNIYKSVNSSYADININLNSSFYITPYSLLSKFMNKIFNDQDSSVYGYLTSSNLLKISDLLALRNIKINSSKEQFYFYKSKEKDKNLECLVKNGWFNWEEENDYNPLIAKCLLMSGKESIISNK